jgi:hypothetical protein
MKTNGLDSFVVGELRDPDTPIDPHNLQTAELGLTIHKETPSERLMQLGQVDTVCDTTNDVIHMGTENGHNLLVNVEDENALILS